jgi:hypothetical protein
MPLFLIAGSGSAIELIRSGFQTTSTHHNHRTQFQTSCHPWGKYGLTSFAIPIMYNNYMLTNSYMLLGRFDL